MPRGYPSPNRPFAGLPAMAGAARGGGAATVPDYWGSRPVPASFPSDPFKPFVQGAARALLWAAAAKAAWNGGARVAYWLFPLPLGWSGSCTGPFPCGGDFYLPAKVQYFNGVPNLGVLCSLCNQADPFGNETPTIGVGAKYRIVWGRRSVIGLGGAVRADTAKVQSLPAGVTPPVYAPPVAPPTRWNRVAGTFPIAFPKEAATADDGFPLPLPLPRPLVPRAPSLPGSPQGRTGGYTPPIAWPILPPFEVGVDFNRRTGKPTITMTRPDVIPRVAPAVPEQKQKPSPAVQRLFRLMAQWSEANDFVEALYKSLPRNIRRQYPNTALGRMSALIQHWREIDVAAAVQWLALNELEDAGAGRGIGRQQEISNAIDPSGGLWRYWQTWGI